MTAKDALTLLQEIQMKYEAGTSTTHSHPSHRSSYPPDHDYSCGAAFCDDPACNSHGAKNADDELLYWKGKVNGA